MWHVPFIFILISLSRYRHHSHIVYEYRFLPPRSLCFALFHYIYNEQSQGRDLYNPLIPTSWTKIKEITYPGPCWPTGEGSPAPCSLCQLLWLTSITQRGMGKEMMAASTQMPLFSLMLVAWIYRHQPVIRWYKMLWVSCSTAQGRAEWAYWQADRNSASPLWLAHKYAGIGSD